MSAALSQIGDNGWVDESVRRANSRATAKRKTWRRQYREVATLIRKMKKERNHPLFASRASDITLRALQAQATALMARHAVIKDALRESNYKWV